MQHLDSDECFSILDGQCGDTEDVVIVTPIPEISRGRLVAD